MDRALPPPLPCDVPQRFHARDYCVAIVEDWRQLAGEIEAWDDLADSSLEPNVFYSAAVVLAAMRHLRPDGKPEFLLVRSTDRGNPSAPPKWCGFFPFLRHRSYRGLPAPNLRLLHHDYCFLRTPLLRSDCAGHVLRLAFDWMKRSGASLVEWGDQAGDGRYAELLADMFHEQDSRALLLGSHARAKLVDSGDASEYLRQRISGGKVKDLRRLERRLSEQGELRYECVGSSQDWRSSLAEFLALEAAGWKGRQETALASRESHRLFFSEVVEALTRRDRVRISSLRLNGRAIAMKCNFLSPPGSFAFKIAYDEALHRYSPGQLLEIDNIRRLHAEPVIRWMDSCADPGHPMIEHLWKDRRLIHTWLVPTSAWGRFVVAAVPLIQWAKRLLVPRKVRQEISS